MAVDSGHCRALLARSLTSQSVPIELVKATCFLCVVNQWSSDPIDPRMGGGLRAWVVHSPGAPTATAAVIGFPLFSPLENSREYGSFVADETVSGTELTRSS